MLLLTSIDEKTQNEVQNIKKENKNWSSDSSRSSWWTWAFSTISTLHPCSWIWNNAASSKPTILIFCTFIWWPWALSTIFLGSRIWKDAASSVHTILIFGTNIFARSTRTHHNVSFAEAEVAAFSPSVAITVFVAPFVCLAWDKRAWSTFSSFISRNPGGQLLFMNTAASTSTLYISRAAIVCAYVRVAWLALLLAAAVVVSTVSILHALLFVFAGHTLASWATESGYTVFIL